MVLLYYSQIPRPRPSNESEPVSSVSGRVRAGMSRSSNFIGKRSTAITIYLLSVLHITPRTSCVCGESCV